MLKALEERLHGARAGRRGPRAGDRLPGLLPAGAAGHRRAARCPLLQGQAGGRAPRSSPSRWSAARSSSGCASPTGLGPDDVHAPADLPFFAKQDRELIGRNRLIDPCDIGDYIAAGGYSALAKVLTSMEPEAVIEEIKASGLRGRGGGGYPTGRKWEQCRQAPGDERYVICNADEGDPGAYMDRGLLEGNPHSILEGMMHRRLRHRRAARATSTCATSIRWRSLTPARPSSRRGSSVCWATNILGTDFSFDVKVARGGGAFVCGESTALMASLRGRGRRARGQGRPHRRARLSRSADRPQQRGDLGQRARASSCNGAGLVRRQGHREEQGHQDLRPHRPREEHRPGRGRDGHDAARDRLRHRRRGRRTARHIKAVQTGGPSGGCLPVSQFDLPVDYEALAAAGSMMGSGGMVVMDESACMVDVAKYFLRVPPGRVVRQVRALPPRHRPHARDPHRHHRGPGPHGATRHAQRPGLDHVGRARSARWARPRPTRCSPPCATSPTSTRPTSRTSVARPASARRWCATRIDPDLCTQCGVVRRRLPARSHRRGRRRTASTTTLCERCGICARPVPPKPSAESEGGIHGEDGDHHGRRGDDPDARGHQRPGSGPRGGHLHPQSVPPARRESHRGLPGVHRGGGREATAAR